MNKYINTAANIFVGVSIVALGVSDYVNRTNLDAANAALKSETTYHQPTVAQCERAVTLGIQAMGAFNPDTNAVQYRVYDLTASEPAVIRQNAARVATMMEAHHRIYNLREPNQQVLEFASKGMKLACQKQKLS